MRFSSPTVPKCTKFKIFRGSAPRAQLGSLQRSPDPLAGGEGARCPLSKNPPPLSALRASSVGPAFGPRSRPTHLLKFDKYSAVSK